MSQIREEEKRAKTFTFESNHLNPIAASHFSLLLGMKRSILARKQIKAPDGEEEGRALRKKNTFLNCFLIALTIGLEKQF